MVAWLHAARIRAALFLSIVVGLGIAHAKPTPPCDRCVLELPSTIETDTPMLVVLHGDREHARDAAARWRSATKARGWILLALEVPDGTSWWEWNGDASWVIARAEKVASEAKLDGRRMFLAGWSGGATYIGDHVQAWDGVFAALVVHGGGRAPVEAACVKRIPAFFLVGDRNPLHRLAIELRRYLEGCRQDVVWDLVKRGAHDAERKALTRAKATAILRWLAAREKR